MQREIVGLKRGEDKQPNTLRATALRQAGIKLADCSDTIGKCQILLQFLLPIF